MAQPLLWGGKIAEGSVADNNTFISKSVEPDLVYIAPDAMTGSQVLDWIWANVDRTKLTVHSKFVFGNGVYSNYLAHSGGGIQAYGVGTTPTYAVYVAFLVDGTTKRWFWKDTDVLTSIMLQKSSKLEVYY